MSLRPALSRLQGRSFGEARELLASRVVFEPGRNNKRRKRLFPPAATFSLFLWQIVSGNLSCSETVQRALAWLCHDKREKASTNTAAYCKARARLDCGAMTNAWERVVENLESRAQPEAIFAGRRVRIVDGTGISMPDTPANQKRFPQHKKQKPGCGFPTMRLVAIFCLATGAIVRAAWDSLAVHERTLFHRIWEHLEKGDIVVADRGFCGFADFWTLLQRGVDCLMRKHPRRSTGERTLKRSGRGDRLVAWKKTGVRPNWLDYDVWKEMPEELTVRQIEVAVEIEGFRTRNIVLVTTLLDAALYPAQHFAELYRRRWLAELFLRDIKISMRMDVLKCQSPAMIEKELVMYLIAYDLVRLLMLEAAQTHGADPLRISFKRTADALRVWGPVLDAARSRPLALKRLSETLLHYIARLIVPHRPNRTEPRALKRRKKNYALLNAPRNEYREIRHRNKYSAGLS